MLWGCGAGGWLLGWGAGGLGARLLHRGVRPQPADEQAALGREALALSELGGELRVQRGEIRRLRDVALVEAVEEHLHRGHRVGLHDRGVRRALLGGVARLVDDLHLRSERSWGWLRERAWKRGGR